jgi:hypothetical protein
MPILALTFCQDGFPPPSPPSLCPPRKDAVRQRQARRSGTCHPPGNDHILSHFSPPNWPVSDRCARAKMNSREKDQEACQAAYPSAAYQPPALLRPEHGAPIHRSTLPATHAPFHQIRNSKGRPGSPARDEGQSRISASRAPFPAFNANHRPLRHRPAPCPPGTRL